MQPDLSVIAAAFPIGTIRSIEPLGNGRIHATYLVRSDMGEYVLQKIGVLFVPALPDIEAVTAHIAAKGLLTSRVVRTEDGALSRQDGDSAWRLMTFIPGMTIETEPTPAQAANGAAFIAQFHTALADYTQPFAYRIPHYRDTGYALGHLHELDRRNTGSSKYEKCHPLAEEIEHRRTLLSPAMSALPLHTLHGDLKLNNLRFDTEGVEAIALLDLDTLGSYPLPLELGDMLRSWCKRGTGIDTETWKTLMKTYREHAAFMHDDEWRLIPDGFFEITLSLAARYCADAYEETWFKHNPEYPSLFEQNVASTERCLALLDDFTTKLPELRQLHD
ncbi:phosphotransferase [bacterium]|nr:phosphotransferase [bacterium]